MKRSRQEYIKELKASLTDTNPTNSEIEELLRMVDIISSNDKRCEVCRKKHDSKTKYYGSTCIKNLYKKSDIIYIKDIGDEELFLHTVILLRLNKLGLDEEKSKNIIQSYLCLVYFNDISVVDLSIIEEKIKEHIDFNKKPIMKLNTAYRINNIIKRNNNMFQTTQDSDNIIDKKILTFFKTYFVISRIENALHFEVYYYMQLIMWLFVALGGKFLNYRFSSKCLMHSLSVLKEKPTDMNINIINDDSNIISKIKRDNGFKIKILDIINKYSNDNVIIFNEKVSKTANTYEFSNGDLLYSLHKVNIEIDGKKTKNKGELYIKLYDSYDFTEILTNNKKSINQGDILNDMAAISTQYGVLKPYNIVIKFKWEI